MAKKDVNKAIFLEEAVLFIRNMGFSKPCTFDINHDSPFIKIHFEYQGSSHYEPSTTDGVPVTLKGGEYNFFYLPKVKGALTVSPDLDKTNIKQSIEFECRLKFLQRIFKDELYDISGSFGEAILRQKPFKMFNESPEIPLILNDILTDIVSSSQKNEIDLVYIESRLIKIFHYLFGEIKKRKQVKPQSTLGEIELEQVARAEKILWKHLQKPITVEELARFVGINRYKLNRNFKQVYNEPIFSYLTRIRMENAKIMLVNKSMNVSEVAYAVGYKNPQHFTVAFKKYFDQVPSKFKTS